MIPNGSIFIQDKIFTQLNDRVFDWDLINLQDIFHGLLQTNEQLLKADLLSEEVGPHCYHLKILVKKC